MVFKRSDLRSDYDLTRIMSFVLPKIQCVFLSLFPSKMLFKAVGKEPNFFFAPLWLFDVIIDSLQWVADTFKNEGFENAAELGRIGTFVVRAHTQIHQLNTGSMVSSVCSYGPLSVTVIS